MAANPVMGVCICPLCGSDGAEVRQGAKGALYIVCDECVSQVRTMSRKGRRCIETLTQKELAAAAPVVEEKPQEIAAAATVEDAPIPAKKIPAAKAVKAIKPSKPDSLIPAWMRGGV